MAGSNSPKHPTHCPLMINFAPRPASQGPSPCESGSASKSRHQGRCKRLYAPSYRSKSTASFRRNEGQSVGVAVVSHDGAEFVDGLR